MQTALSKDVLLVMGVRVWPASEIRLHDGNGICCGFPEVAWIAGSDKFPLYSGLSDWPDIKIANWREQQKKGHSEKIHKLQGRNQIQCNWIGIDKHRP